MKRTIFLIIFAICSILVFSDTLFNEDAKLHYKTNPTKIVNLQPDLPGIITSGRVFDTLEDLKKKANITEPILLRKFTTDEQRKERDGNANASRKGGVAVISVSRYYCTGLATPEAIKMVIAHELSHIILHVKKRQKSNNFDDFEVFFEEAIRYLQFRPIYEDEADSLAIRLIGFKIFKKGNIDVGNYMFCRKSKKHKNDYRYFLSKFQNGF